MQRRLRPSFPGLVAGFAALLASSLAPASAGVEDPCAWTEGYSFADLNGTVRTLAVFDDGSGPALYAGGIFTAAGGERASRVARWDGAAWSALGLPGAEGVGGSVDALAVFDDGSGAALYVAGFFSTAGGAPANNVARWDGATWSTLGSGATNGVSGTVEALAIHDDGGGEALYLGGQFVAAGGTTVNRIAKWDGRGFSALPSTGGPGLEDEVRALATFAGSLVAAGDFQNAGGTLVKGIASWNGTAWSALPGPTDVGLDGLTHRLRVFDLGGGPELFVAGELFAAGGLAVNDIARWNGTAWSAMGTHPVPAEANEMLDLAVYDPGTGPALYAGGKSFNEDEPVRGFVARWNGASWVGLQQTDGQGLDNRVRALLAHDDGTGPRLFVGGDLVRVGNVALNHLGRYDGAAWSRLSTAPPVGLDGGIHDFALFDDGTGPKLYAAGRFTVAGPVVANHVARWNGITWEALPGPGGVVGTDFEAAHALAVFDDGGGPQLYVGGEFDHAGGIPVKNIARWDGDSWSAVPGLAGITVFYVTALEVFDGELYVGGQFSIGGQSDSVLRFDGTAWSRLAGPSGTGTNFDVHALEVFDDGSGAALYLGGGFTTAGGMAAQGMARWDGAAWSSMPGVLVASGAAGAVGALAVFSDAQGPALYAGGNFQTAGGVTANNVARFRQGAWSALTGTGGPGLPGPVGHLAVLTGTAQPYLVATGNFSTAGGQTVNKIARWNGAAWSPLAGPSGTGLEGPTDFSQVMGGAVFAFDDGPGPGVFVSGEFAFAGGLPSGRVGRWVCPLLFADGFETGDTSAWTRTVP